MENKKIIVTSTSRSRVGINIPELHFKREMELAEYRKECRDKGFDLLKKYFDCLWD